MTLRSILTGYMNAVMLKAMPLGPTEDVSVRAHQRRAGHIVATVPSYHQRRRKGRPNARRARKIHTDVGSSIDRDRPGVDLPRTGGGHPHAFDMREPVIQELFKHEVIPTTTELRGVEWWRHTYPSQCYDTAGRFMLQTPIEDAVLVHGVYKPLTMYASTGHGWVELPNNRLFDGNFQRFFDRDAYYRIFRARPVVRYDRTKALVKMLRTRTFGPWRELGGGDNYQGPPHAMEMINTEAAEKRKVRLIAKYAAKYGVPDVPNMALKKGDAPSWFISTPNPPLSEEDYAEILRQLGLEKSQRIRVKPYVRRGIYVRGYEQERKARAESSNWADGDSGGSDRDTARRFTSKKAADAWGRQQQGWARDLTELQQQALHYYSVTVGLNESLRARRPMSTERVYGSHANLERLGHRLSEADALAALDSIFAKPEARLAEDVIVHRAWRKLKRREVGSTFTDRGFVSTALVPDETSVFAEDPNTGRRDAVHVTIRVPAGTPALYLGVQAPSGDWSADSTELVLNRGLRFRVVRSAPGRDRGSMVLEVIS